LYFERLKQKWGIQSNAQLVVVFIVFGITGSLSLRLAKPVLNFLQLTPEAFSTIPLGELLYWSLRILVIFPIYQLVLLAVGTLFFQFKFFWNFEKRILKRIGFKSFFKGS
jgi:hypothetical protein